MLAVQQPTRPRSIESVFLGASNQPRKVRRVAPPPVAAVLRTIDYNGADQERSKAEQRTTAVVDGLLVPKAASRPVSVASSSTDSALSWSTPATSIASYEPLALPEGLSWTTVDLENASQLAELHDLLSNHLVRDDAPFQPQHTPAMLKWAMQLPADTPRALEGWGQGLLGIRMTTGKLVAFIGAVPQMLRVGDTTQLTPSTSFFCLHTKLRGKGLSALLHQEAMRRAERYDIRPAVWTGAVSFPTPSSKTQHFCRPINVKKMVDLKFAQLPTGQSLGRTIVRSKLPLEASLPGFRPLEERDLGSVFTLLRRYYARFDVAPEWRAALVWHLFFSSSRRTEPVVKGRRPEQLVYAFVVEDPRTGRITDFASFTATEWSTCKLSRPQTIDSASLFYYATDAIPRLTKPWQQETSAELQTLRSRLGALMGDVLVAARDLGFDVLTADSSWDAALFLDDLKFWETSAATSHRLWDWQVKSVADE